MSTQGEWELLQQRYVTLVGPDYARSHVGQLTGSLAERTGRLEQIIDYRERLVEKYEQQTSRETFEKILRECFAVVEERFGTEKAQAACPELEPGFWERQQERFRGQDEEDAQSGAPRLTWEDRYNEIARSEAYCIDTTLVALKGRLQRAQLNAPASLRWELTEHGAQARQEARREELEHLNPEDWEGDIPPLPLCGPIPKRAAVEPSSTPARPEKRRPTDADLDVGTGITAAMDAELGALMGVQAFALWLCLLRHANGRRGRRVAGVGLLTIGRAIGLSKWQAQRAVKVLIRHGLIDRPRVGSRNRGERMTTSEYVVPYPKPERLAEWRRRLEAAA